MSDIIPNEMPKPEHDNTDIVYISDEGVVIGPIPGGSETVGEAITEVNPARSSSETDSEPLFFGTLGTMAVVATVVAARLSHSIKDR